MDGIELEHCTLAVRGIELHVVTAGPEDGPLAVLLHGFPELWYGWHHQIEPLARAGYRVVVPDQRGYNLSDKPQGVSAYAIDELASDVVAIIEAQGRDWAHVAGHDWGAAVGWHLAATRPERVGRMVLVNVPHPAVLARTIRRSTKQLRKSWYMLFFQLPWLPEWFATKNDSENLVRALRATSRRGTFSDADLEIYRAAWAQPGAITGMINWYRAAVRMVSSPLPDHPITVPIHLLWGRKDRFLGSEMAAPSLALCEEAKLTLVDDATHWVHHERPELVSDVLVEWFGGDALPDEP
ncbi:MAG: alpha/beta fold hydrolase [Deltaproteobacteria bacterium]|nr:alpha/beta fold hydrolase [Deltaproteobacteria bacterium]